MSFLKKPDNQTQKNINNQKKQSYKRSIYFNLKADPFINLSKIKNQKTKKQE